MSEKPTNPKDAIGLTKTPLHLVSGIVKAYHSIALYLGMVKYGAWNYRIGGARASVYKAALDRHMDRWWEGEELDPVDGTPHLANALACISILIETAEGGNLVDDRPPSRDLSPVYAKIEKMMVAINERYPYKKPRHYTIADTPKTFTDKLVQDASNIAKGAMNVSMLDSEGAWRCANCAGYLPDHADLCPVRDEKG